MNRPDLHTVPCPIAGGATRDPDQPALIAPERTFSYAELDAEIRSQTEAMGSLVAGTGPGTRVAISMDSGWRFAVAIWMLFRLGAVAVPLSTREPETVQDELASRIGCRAVLRRLPMEDPRPGHAGKAVATGRPELILSQPATIIFTSGSSGAAKGVVHSLANHWFSAIGSQDFIPVDADTRWLVALPMYHVGGLSILFRCFIHGGAAAMQGRIPIHEAISRFGATHLSLVPTQLTRLLDAGSHEALRQLRYVLVGGAAAPSGLLQRAAGLGIEVRNTYGSTEMSSQVATAKSIDDIGTAGYVLPYRQLRISDGGEIHVRGRTRFLGYADEGNGLQTPFDEDGWFATGDLGRFDSYGRLEVLGRNDTMFVSGGENIHPEEIEAAVLATGLVEAAVVVAVEDEEFGFRPVVFVYPFVDIGALRDALTGRIASFKMPDRVFELPPDAGRLKPDRRRLSDLARSL